MRITCPNCGAQYEVDDALIPETGRDVQCSNCGRGWFQSKHDTEMDAAPAATPVEDAEDDVRPDPDFDALDPENEPPVTENTFGDLETEERPAEAEAGSPTAGLHEPYPADQDAEIPGREPDETASDRTAAAGEDAETAPEEPATWTQEAEEPEEVATSPEDRSNDDEDTQPETAAVAPAPRPTDESVLAVLREEAEREIAARRTEAPGTLETQTELGLEEAPEPRKAPTEEVSLAATVASGARRDLLPDIDEINSSLRSDSDRGVETVEEDDGAVVSERRRGFRLGFGIMILIAAAMITLYVASGWIVATVPTLEPSVIAYVDWANGVRDWLDDLLAAGVTQLSE